MSKDCPPASDRRMTREPPIAAEWSQKFALGAEAQNRAVAVPVSSAGAGDKDAHYHWLQFKRGYMPKAGTHACSWWFQLAPTLEEPVTTAAVVTWSRRPRPSRSGSRPSATGQWERTHG